MTATHTEKQLITPIIAFNTGLPLNSRRYTAMTNPNVAAIVMTHNTLNVIVDSMATPIFMQLLDKFKHIS